MMFSADENVDAAFQAMDELERLSDPVAIVDRLARHLSRYGFEAFLVTGLPVQRERLEPYILLNGWPERWYARYMQANHYRNDPCVRNCFASIEPFGWDELPAPLLADPAAAIVMGEAASFGLRQGLCVPLHDAYGFQAVVTMAGDRIELPPRARRLVHLLSLYAYGSAERASRALTGRSQDRLSERECEVLRWTASGKTSWEVGQILTISEDTVRDHLKNVRRKLRTANNVHSVVEAMRRREIRL